MGANAITHACEISQGMNYALRCLSQRDYSTGKLREKLSARGYFAESIEHIINRLTGLSYIDDERYAAMIVKNYQGKYGRKRIQSILKSQCISVDIITVVLENIDEEKESITAKAIIEKELRKSQHKLSSPQDLYRISQRLVYKLMSRGIEMNLAYGEVKSAMSELSDAD